MRGATEIAVGDIDGDWTPDVIGPWEGDRVTVLRGPLFDPTTIPVCGRPVGLAIADLNGDGRGEVIATCATEKRVAIVAVPERQ